tara:strand:- start:345 stop:803 length:459 start_codon:yes stop_codon:yes gene_type:complete
MSEIEDRKKERIKKVLDAILDSNPITAISRRVNKATRSLLKGKLTKEKEFTIKGLISDLKLSSGDRGAAEAMPKKDFDESVARTKMIRNIQKNIKPAPMPNINPYDDEGYITIPNPRGEGTIKVKPMKKGGKIKTKSKYSKGGGVRPAKYKI